MRTMIYLVKNKLDNRVYIGTHDVVPNYPIDDICMISQSLVNGYVGYGNKLLKNDIRWFKKENFSIDIITTCISEKADYIKQNCIVEFISDQPGTGYNHIPDHSVESLKEEEKMLAKRREQREKKKGSKSE